MFGLFESIASKATKEATAAVRLRLSLLPGIPPGMWESPYVLGFLNQTITFYAKMATNGRVSGADLGQTILNVYTAVSHQNGTVIMRIATKFMQDQHSEFLRGVDDAMMIQFFTLGTLRDESAHPVLVQAKADAADGGGAGDKSLIIALMITATWCHEVEMLANDK